MSTFNQRTLSVLLVSASVLVYLLVGSILFNAKADYDCMKLRIPQAQVVGLKTYCGGVWQGTEQYIPISAIGKGE